MGIRNLARHFGFWTMAVLWLPAGIVSQAAIRFLPDRLMLQTPGELLADGLDMAGSLLPVALCGLPLALGCRRLSRLGRRRLAWTTGIGLGVATIFASLIAGLFGPVAILAVAVVLSLPAWIASWWIVRRS